MKIYLARHAETNYNVMGLCNADPSVDVHLSEAGIEQAKRLAEDLRDSSFEAVYVSTLPRTYETASYINASHSKPVFKDARLNDNATGYESRPIQEWYDALAASPNRWEAVFNEGESLQAALERTRQFMDDLAQQPYESVLIVTHGYITKCIQAIIGDLTLEAAASLDIPQGTFITLRFA